MSFLSICNLNKEELTNQKTKTCSYTIARERSERVVYAWMYDSTAISHTQNKTIVKSGIHIKVSSV